MFKNLSVFRVGPNTLSAAQLDAALSRARFNKCTASAMASAGFSPVDADSDKLVRQVSGRFMLMSFMMEKKLLPSSVINEVAKERAVDIEEQQGYKPGRKQMKEIKEAVTDELLPKAFSQKKRTLAWIDTKENFLFIDSASAGVIDAFTSAFVKAADGVEIAMLQTNTSPTSAMTAWVADLAGPDGFSIDYGCLLKGQEKASLRFTNHAVNKVVAERIKEGMLPAELSMTWSDRCSFVLTSTLAIKRLQMLDVITEGMEEVGDATSALDAAVMIEATECANLMNDLIQVLDGEITS